MSTSEQPPGQTPGASSSTTGPGASTTGPTPPVEGRPGRRGRRGGPAPGPGEQARNMLPSRTRRRFGLERILVRLVATGGVIGIGVALGAILAASKVQGWIIGLVVAAVSVILSATLWSSRQL